MNLIGTSIQRPIAVMAAVLMVVMFGYVALQTIPIQLTPDINRPIIVITTNWGGAAPAEVEREIVNRQEEALKGLEGLEEIVSSSGTGRGQITLTFNIDTNMDPGAAADGEPSRSGERLSGRGQRADHRHIRRQ